MCTQSVAIVMSTDTPEPEPWPEPDYLMPKSKWSEQKLEIIPGEKKGSEWLIINDEFILNKNRTFKNGNIVWECRSRRWYKCPFRMETEMGEESVNMLWMFENDIQTCVHDPSVILVHKFKTEVKTVPSTASCTILQRRSFWTELKTHNCKYHKFKLRNTVIFFPLRYPVYIYTYTICIYLIL